jgi:alpha-L-arabinofuranosidase
VMSIADAVRAELGRSKKINTSFDEWNVWYSRRYRAVEENADRDSWPVAPRLIEDSYSVLDAVVVGSLLISLLKHADRVRSAALAQLVNVIAPIVTEPEGEAWRQTIFFPFALTSRLAVGEALTVGLTSDSHETEAYGKVNTVDGVATRDAATGRSAIFLVNRALDAAASVTIDVSRLGDVSIEETHTLADNDIYARNTHEDQQRVQVSPNATARIANGQLTVELPAVSWSAIALR